jgi:hypothetical protein
MAMYEKEEEGMVRLAWRARLLQGPGEYCKNTISTVLSLGGPGAEVTRSVAV